jgi:hypothetical protein
MQNIRSSDELKNAILLLEGERVEKGLLLKEQLYLTYESVKPVNIIKHAIKDITSSPHLIDDILGTGIGIASGFLSKRIFIGPSGNKIRQLLGTILQFGVTNVVAQHPDSIKSIGQIIMQYFLRRKEANSKKL